MVISIKESIITWFVSYNDNGCAGGHACGEIPGALDPSRSSLPGKELAPCRCVHKGEMLYIWTLPIAALTLS